MGFKNYEEGRFEFSRSLNCIVGENGSGKTNLLDAIYWLGLTKSAFQVQDAFSLSLIHISLESKICQCLRKS